MRIGRATASDYGAQGARLLPRGPFWRPPEDGPLAAMLDGMGATLALLHNRGLDLIEEADPRAADETLGHWEEVAGLPSVDGMTTAERRRRLHARVAFRGGVTPQWFRDAADALGATGPDDGHARIDHYHHLLFVCGHSRAGDPLYGPGYAHAILVTADAALSAAIKLELMTLFLTRRPAHVVARFAFE